MKLSIATIALSAFSFFPSAMGQGRDESCFFMYKSEENRARRQLDEEGFYSNPKNLELKPGVVIDCDDHDTITAAGFVKYTAADVCDHLVEGFVPGQLSQCEDEPTQCGALGKCPYDIWWTCKENFEDEDDIIKAVICGTVENCKIFPCPEPPTVVVALDPHFKTWATDDSWYDFHGQCDLKYMSDPEFYFGLGLEIDIRTKGRYDYSFVESAAIKLGDDIFEFSSYGDVVYNGVESAKVDGVKMADKFEIKKTHDDKIKKTYTIHIHQNQYVEMSSFKDMVSVKVHNASKHIWGDTVGMMGSFPEGTLLGRDGKTVYNINDQEEINAFGQEWQVLASEPSLFLSPSDPSQKCVLPSKTASVKRRLGEKSISEEDARAACDNSAHIEMCVYDVIATGDLSIAQAGVY